MAADYAGELEPFVSTGLTGLDAILGGLRLGDNVVWRVDSVDAYRAFVAPFVAEARTAGYDAVDSMGRRIQIKARSIPRDKKLVGQRLGTIRLDHEWDVVLLVVMDELFELRWIFEAERPAIEAALKAPGSKARNERGALALAKFKSIGRQVWPADT